MENRFKMRISRMFRSSFGSCKSKNISDVIDNNKPVFYPQNRQHNYELVELISSKPRPFPSMYTPKCPENFQTPGSGVRTTLTRAVSVYCRNSTSNTDGRKCPPASPILSQNIYYQSTTKKKKKKNKNRRAKIKRFEFEEFGSFDYKGYLFSSDEKSDEKTTFFSSRSFTSDSSDSFKHKRVSNMRKKRASRNKEDEAKSVKGSLAVVKKSSDPYNDFRDSMLEMIVENQIFAAKDLEKLLECFLILNSHHHHGVILEVFTEICEALFSNWS